MFVTAHDHLSAEFDKILNYAIRQDLAAFLTHALPNDPNSHLPFNLKSKREKAKKANRIESWKDLDLAELLEVVDDRYTLLEADGKSRKVKKCIERVRDLRNDVAHRTGEVDIDELLYDTRMLLSFAEFIRARAATVEEIQKLKQKLHENLTYIDGIHENPDSPALPESRPNYFRSTRDPFAEFTNLLKRHERLFGRANILRQIRDSITEHPSGTLVIEAVPGTGKSALIAHCIQHEVNDWTPRPAYYLYNDGEGLTDPAKCLRTLYEQLIQRHGIERAEALYVADQPRDLWVKLQRLLTDHVAPRLGQNKQLILIDALDEAKTDGEMTAYQALPAELPEGVYVIASTRAIPDRSDVLARRKHVQWLNLNTPDLNSDNQRDAKEFVAFQLKDKLITQATQDEICRLGAGNFLVLRESCRWIRERLASDEVSSFLRKLAVDQGGPLHAIYDEFWGRLAKAHLDAVSNVAGLILAAREPVSDALALETLVNGRTTWEIGIEYLAEYLRRIDGDGGRASYGIYHQSFADYVRTRVGPECQSAKQSLAAMCLKWRELTGDLRRYTLQHEPMHLCDAEKWTDLESLLTDLEFVEAKCSQHMVRELAADYQLAREQHPDWQKAVKEELDHEASVNRWAEDVIEAGCRWRAELDRKWSSDDPDLVELAKPFPFPKPPDTSQVRARVLDDSGTTKRQFNERVTKLQILRCFVIHLADALISHPTATLAFAFSYHVALTEQAESLLRSRNIPWFETHPRPHVDPHGIPLPSLRVDAQSFAVSANGKWCVTGEKNGDLRFWDLVTGKCVDDKQPAHAGELTKILISVDGRRVISFGANGSIAIHDFQNGRWQSVDLGLNVPHVTVAACSPEASVVVAAGHDDKIRVFDGQTGKLLRKAEFSHRNLQDITNLHLIPEQFELRAADKTGNVAVWDLGSQNLIRFIPPDPVPMSEGSGERDGEYDDELLRWLNSELPVSISVTDAYDYEPIEPIGSRLGQFWNPGSVSADGLIEVKKDVGDSDWSAFYCNGKFIVDLDGDPPIYRLTADGRVLWTSFGRVDGFDVSKIKSLEGIERRDSPVPRQDPTRFDIGFDLPEQEDHELESMSFTILSCRHLPAEEEDSAHESDETDAFAAITPDCQIAIGVIIADEQESDDEVEDEDDDDEEENEEFLGPAFHLFPVQGDYDDATTCSFYVRVSPNGERAFIAVSPNTQPARCFLWDIPSGEKVLSSVSDCWEFFDVMPDWKSVVTIEDEMVTICDLETAEPLLTMRGSGVTAITPDGRKLVTCTDDGISVWPLTHSQQPPILHCPGGRQACVSPDAKFLVCAVGEELHVYDLRSGTQLLVQPFRYTKSIDSWTMWRSPRIGGDGIVLGIDSRKGRRPQLSLWNLPRIAENFEPLATATRVFHYQLDDPEFQRLVANGKPLPSGVRIPGVYDTELTAVCPNCGKRFTVPHDAEHVLNSWSQAAGLSAKRSPCLDLPDSAWDDPALKGECTHCHQTLRMNPFIA